MLVIYYLYENIKASYEDIALSLQNVEAGSVYNWLEELYSYSHGNSIFEWSTVRLQNGRCGPYLNLKETEHMVTSNNPLSSDQQGRFTPAIVFFDVFFKVTLLFGFLTRLPQLLDAIKVTIMLMLSFSPLFLIFYTQHIVYNQVIQHVIKRKSVTFLTLL